MGGQGGRGRDVNDAQNDVGPPCEGVLGRRQSEFRPQQTSDRYVTVVANRVCSQPSADERGRVKSPIRPRPRRRRSHFHKGEDRESDVVEGSGETVERERPNEGENPNLVSMAWPSWQSSRAWTAASWSGAGGDVESERMEYSNEIIPLWGVGGWVWGGPALEPDEKKTEKSSEDRSLMILAGTPLR